MRLTVNELRRIIKEEVSRVMGEAVVGSLGTVKGSKYIDAIVGMVNQALAGEPVSGHSLAQAYFDGVNRLTGARYTAGPGIKGDLVISGKNLPDSISAKDMHAVVNAIEFAAETEEDELGASFGARGIMSDIEEVLAAAGAADAKVSGLTGRAVGELPRGQDISPEEEEADYDRWTMDKSGKWVGSYHPENPKYVWPSGDETWNEGRRPTRKLPRRR